MNRLPLHHYSMCGDGSGVYETGKSGGEGSWVPSFDEVEVLEPAVWVVVFDDIELEHR